MKKKLLAVFLVLNLMFGASLAQAALGFFIGSAILHAIVLSIVISKDDSSTSSSSQNTLTVSLSPNNAFPLPDGWTPPVVDGGEPLPPSTKAMQTTPSAATSDEFGHAWVAANRPNNVMIGTFVNKCTNCINPYFPGSYYINVSSCSSGDSNPTFCAYPFSDYIFPDNSVDMIGYECPVQGSLTCSIIPTAVIEPPPDNTCFVRRVGNTFEQSAGDVDCVGLNTTLNSLVVTPNSVTALRDNKAFSVDLLPDGSARIFESSVDAATGDISSTTTLVSAPDASGNVSIDNIAVSNGTGSDGTNTAGNSGTGNITGFNLETTQKSIDDSQKTIAITSQIMAATQQTMAVRQQSIDSTLKNILGDPVVQPTENSQLDSAMSEFEGVAEGINTIGSGDDPFESIGIDNPFSVKACAPIGFLFKGNSISYDLCPHVGTIKNVLGSALYLVTGSMLFGMFTSRPS